MTVDKAYRAVAWKGKDVLEDSQLQSDFNVRQKWTQRPMLLQPLDNEFILDTSTMSSRRGAARSVTCDPRGNPVIDKTLSEGREHDVSMRRHRAQRQLQPSISLQCDGDESPQNSSGVMRRRSRGRHATEGFPATGGHAQRAPHRRLKPLSSQVGTAREGEGGTVSNDSGGVLVHAEVLVPREPPPVGDGARSRNGCGSFALQTNMLSPPRSGPTFSPSRSPSRGGGSRRGSKESVSARAEGSRRGSNGSVSARAEALAMRACGLRSSSDVPEVHTGGYTFSVRRHRGARTFEQQVSGRFDQNNDLESNDFAVCVEIARKFQLPLRAIREMRQEFLAVDANGDEKLSLDEFKQVVKKACDLPDGKDLPPHLLYNHWGEIDKGKDGIIDFEEYVLWRNNHSYELAMIAHPCSCGQIARKYGISLARVERLKKMFDMFDSDGDGSIDDGEFKQLLIELLCKGSDAHLSQSNVAKHWNDADSDGSGDVTFEEYVVWYLNYVTESVK